MGAISSWDHLPDLVRSEANGAYRVVCSCGYSTYPEVSKYWSSGVEINPTQVVMIRWGEHLLRLALNNPAEHSVWTG